MPHSEAYEQAVDAYLKECQQEIERLGEISRSGQISERDWLDEQLADLGTLRQQAEASLQRLSRTEGEEYEQSRLESQDVFDRLQMHLLRTIARLGAVTNQDSSESA